ncbi:MAG: thiamine-binding protein [Bacteroidota bacterium]
MSVLMNFAMFPTDKGASVSPYVAKIIAMISELGYEYRLTAMGTIVETPTLQQALDVVDSAYKLLEPDCERVYVSINLDIRKGDLGRIDSKIKSVTDKLKK